MIAIHMSFWLSQDHYQVKRLCDKQCSITGANGCAELRVTLLNALPGVQREHPDEAVAVKIIGREAGERWKSMSNEDKEPYETLSSASKAEYARMKQLTPAERIMVLAAQAMHQPVRCIYAYMSSGF